MQRPRFQDPDRPEENEFWLVKTPEGTEGMIILCIDRDIGEMEVIKLNAFELGTINKDSEWVKIDSCEFQGKVEDKLPVHVNGLTGKYEVEVDEENIRAAFNILEITNAL
tara:strand:- start:39 stop:368 length:330 start_codon:yes stop_codon:yes gene_type:complete